jgi:hypothetical protein
MCRSVGKIVDNSDVWYKTYAFSFSSKCRLLFWLPPDAIWNMHIQSDLCPQYTHKCQSCVQWDYLDRFFMAPHEIFSVTAAFHLHLNDSVCIQAWHKRPSVSAAPTPTVPPCMYSSSTKEPDLFAYDPYRILHKHILRGLNPKANYPTERPPIVASSAQRIPRTEFYTSTPDPLPFLPSSSLIALTSLTGSLSDSLRLRKSCSV